MLAQTGRRTTQLGVRPFTVDTDVGRREWRQLLLAIEKRIVLADKHPGMLADDLSDYLYARSTGHIGSLMILINRGCQRAVRTGTELLDRVKNDAASEKARQELQTAFDARRLTTTVSYCTEEASRVISTLTRGAVLGLERVLDNPVNPSAIRITHRGLHLGYVPDPLLDKVSAVMSGGQTRLTVVQATYRRQIHICGYCSGWRGAPWVVTVRWPAMAHRGVTTVDTTTGRFSAA